MKKIAMLIFALLLTVLPAEAVQAAAQKNVILNSDNGKAEIYIELPDTAAQISTLRLRVRIGGDTEKIDQTNPLEFQPDEGIRPTFLETRYHAANQTYSIYLSDTSKLTDKTEFRLGTLTPHSLDGTEYSLTITVEEDGLEYVDGTGQLNQEKTAAPASIGIQVNAPENNGDGSAGDTGNDSSNGSGNTGGSGEDSGTGTTSGGKNDSVQQTNSQTNHAQASVKTGDNSHIFLYVILLVAAGVGIASVLVLRKRKNG